jgi:sugar phosphate permease
VARTGNWELPFYLVGVLGVLCGLIFVFLVSTKPVEVAGLAPAAPLREAAK